MRHVQSQVPLLCNLLLLSHCILFSVSPILQRGKLRHAEHCDLPTVTGLVLPAALMTWKRKRPVPPSMARGTLSECSEEACWPLERTAGAQRACPGPALQPKGCHGLSLLFRSFSETHGEEQGALPKACVSTWLVDMEVRTQAVLPAGWRLLRELFVTRA